eukprot:UN11608
MFWDDDGHLVQCYILFNVRLREKLLKIVLDCDQKIHSSHICCAQFQEIRKNNTCFNKLFKQAKITKSKINEGNKTYYSPDWEHSLVTFKECGKMEMDRADKLDITKHAHSNGFYNGAIETNEISAKNGYLTRWENNSQHLNSLPSDASPNWKRDISIKIYR